jgi:sugar transferase (PEP-CTERM/EpsH1 system associated)
MNILWLSHCVPYPPKTGVLQRNYNLLREASKHGKIHLVAVFKENVLPIDFDLDEARHELGKFCETIEFIRLPIESSRFTLLWTMFKSLFTRDPMSINWIKSKHMRQKIRKICQNKTFDLVHFDTISLAAYKGDTEKGVKVLNHHNIESHLFDRRIEYEKNPIKRLYYQIEAKKLARYETEQCPQFDMNFTVSELDSERLISIAPGTRTEVIANGVDVDYFKPDESNINAKNLIMASGMNWFPNRDAVLYMADQIWPLLTEQYTDITWTVVGASPPQQIIELEQQDKRVNVTGFVDDVRPYLDKAEVYLCPMRDGGGTRLKILDALSMGKAIVSTTMGVEGIDVIAEKHVLLADTPEEFVTQIGRVINDVDLRKRLAKEAREFVTQHYSWPVIGEKLGRIYHTITGRPETQ